MVFTLDKFVESMVDNYLETMSDLRQNKNVNMNDIIRLSMMYNLNLLKVIYLNMHYAKMYPTLKNDLEINCKQIAMQIDKFEKFLKNVQTENNQIIQV